ncbi:Ctr copper transporter family-domain-containing protein [Epithele typhae]|uniref:Ctr copper transporter family-domain-containing protein n=1 Tax=Epithele typhae TaxID=378194 RepID=UPI0020083BF9|nr:Ctr copper transporter family-domain-containing protein [Epithele typhae]KAH9926633.1 Ctr copper transporter family-domain-containing protein [Epithele typhae]
MSMSMMSMSSMSMSGTPTGAASAASTSAMSSMDMDMGSGSCQISMLWNWYTIDSCFLSSSWHVTSNGGFAGTCIGVILLVVAVELVRRLQREYDRHLHRTNSALAQSSSVEALDPLKTHVTTDRLTVPQHLLRSLLYTFQFAGAYIIMLLAMYFNGYIIISIFIGGFIGAALFQRDTYGGGQSHAGPETREGCCG